MRKRILSVFMVLCLMMVIAPATFATGEETFDTWDGTTSTTPELVGGVYQIDSAADLVGFAALVNGNEPDADAVLLTGIDLNNTAFTPMGDYSEPYTGTFDGGNHTIKNVSITGSEDVILVGLFGCVSAGTVKNLVLDNVDVIGNSYASSGEDSQQAASGTAIGALIGEGAIENVSNTASCSVSGKYRTGGIVGSTKDAGTTVKNCTNNATVTGERNYTGGIVGAAHNVVSIFHTTGTTFDSCTNNGAVNGSTEVGGIVGYTDQAYVYNCTNTASVYGTGNYGTGGIVGCDIMNLRLIFALDGSTIESCVNRGSVTAPRAGGILGSYVAAPGDNTPSSNVESTITDCDNYGAISSQNGTGVCGAIYGAPISYKYGESQVDHMIVVIKGCTVGGTVEGASVPSDTEAFNDFISPSDYVELNGNTAA